MIIISQSGLLDTTLVSNTRGRGFEPHWEQPFFFIFLLFLYLSFFINTFCYDKLYILTISIYKTSNKIRLTSYNYKLLF